MATPPNAVYVSEDGLVTFDQYGRKLDSLGNVAWDDTQGAWGANAKPIERPQMQQQPQAQQAATPVVKAATGAYSPSVSATPQQGAAAQQRPPVQAYLPQSFQPWNQPQQQQRPPMPWADPMPPLTALSQPQHTSYIPGMTGYAPPRPVQSGMGAGAPYVSPPPATGPASWESQVTMPGYQAPQPVVDPWSVAPGVPYMPQQQVPYGNAWKPSW